MINQKNKTSQNKIYLVLLVLFVIIWIMPLVSHAYIGTFSRMVADDYCAAYRTRMNGVIGHVINYYYLWSGRYSANALDALTLRLGPGFVPYNTALILIIWFVVSLLAFAQIPFSGDKKIRYFSSALLSASIISTTLAVTPNINQSLYWMSGMHYLVPSFIFSTGSVGLFLHITQKEYKNKGKLYIDYVLCFLFSFFSGGFSEIFALPQVIALLIALLAVLVFWRGIHRKQALSVILFSLSGAIAALAFVSLAPGNIARAGASGSTLSLSLQSVLKVIQESIISLRYFYSLFISSRSRAGYSLGLLILSIILGMTFAIKTKNHSISSAFTRIFLLLFPIISLFFLVLSCFIPGAYVGLYENSIPERALIIPLFIVEISLAVWGFIWGSVHQKGILGKYPEQNRLGKWCTLILLFIAAILPVNNSSKTLTINPQIKAYAAQWDMMNAQIIQAKKNGANQITVQAQPDWGGLMKITSDPQHWVNYCVSAYYGIQVTVK
jgi:hypothetical protein